MLSITEVVVTGIIIKYFSLYIRLYKTCVGTLYYCTVMLIKDISRKQMSFFETNDNFILHISCSSQMQQGLRKQMSVCRVICPNVNSHLFSMKTPNG